MRRVGLVILVLLTALALPNRMARAAQDVDLALVLLTDVSRSVDDAEYKLEKQGYATALVNPRVIAAIKGGALGRIAVAYVEFAGHPDVRTVLDWTVIEDEAGARAFVDRLLAEPRS